jgi:hypothetical protein
LPNHPVRGAEQVGESDIECLQKVHSSVNAKGTEVRRIFKLHKFYLLCASFALLLRISNPLCIADMKVTQRALFVFAK